MKRERIIIFGASGMLGKLLSYFFSSSHEVVVVSRSPVQSESARWVAWDGETLGAWADELEGALAVINLAGRSVNCRYHARNRREIMNSRVLSTRVLGEAIARCAVPPKVWLNSSTATIYKHSLDKPMDENCEVAAMPEAKDKFSIEVAEAWEETFYAAPTPATRKVALRTAMVLTNSGNSVYPVLRRLVKFGLGGRMGSGRQFVSWVHERDFCCAVDWLIRNEAISGNVNVAAPNPLPNAEMMRTIRRVLRMPFGLSATAWMLEVGAAFLRTETELIIKSRRVMPARLEACGFRFDFRNFEEAIRNLESQRVR